MTANIENIFYSCLYTNFLDNINCSELEKNIFLLKETEESVKISNAGGWQSKSFGEKDNKFMSTPIDVITQELIPFYTHYGITKKPTLGNYWFNINEKNNFNFRHGHPFCFFSVVFYVKVPKNSGAIIFHRPDILEYTIKTDFVTNANLLNVGFEPKPNLLVAFPSYLEHNVDPSFSEETRISIAFNYL